MSNFDDDEALFDDIYGDDQPSNSVPQTSTLESSEKPLGDNSEPLPPPPPPPPPAQEEQYSAPVTETENASALDTPNNNQFNYSQAFQQLQQFQQLQPQQQGDQNQGQGQDQTPNQQQLEQFQQLQQQFQQFQQNQLQPNGEDDGQFQDTVKADLSGKDVGKLFIGGLNWETDEDALKTYFSQFGEVLEINVMRDNNTGKSRGFAFLTFGSGDSVDAVLKQKHILDGKLIDPKRAIPKEEQEKVGKVFVGGIAADVTPEEFKDYFEKFGSIIDSQLMINKDTGKSRGYGFVTYDSPDAVDRVTRNNYVMFHGKQMEIKKAEPRMQHLKSQNRLPGQMANPMASSQPAVMNQQYMMGGYPTDMTQYWQQMQQMQQYWMQMQQMQQQQMSPDSQEAQLNMQAMFQNQMPSAVMDQQNDQQNDEDDVPNPQENESPSPPPSQNGLALKLPSGPKKFRESGGSGSGRGGRSRGGFGGRGGRGGGRGRGRGRRDGFHPYRR